MFGLTFVMNSIVYGTVLQRKQNANSDQFSYSRSTRYHAVDGILSCEYVFHVRCDQLSCNGCDRWSWMPSLSWSDDRESHSFLNLHHHTLVLIEPAFAIFSRVNGAILQPQQKLNTVNSRGNSHTHEQRKESGLKNAIIGTSVWRLQDLSCEHVFHVLCN